MDVSCYERDSKFHLTRGLSVRIRSLVTWVIVLTVVLAASFFTAPEVVAEEASDETAWCEIYSDVIFRIA